MQNFIRKLERKADDIRKMTTRMCIQAGTGHVTSSLSCVDILVTLYYGGILRHKPEDPQWNERDRLILSKGQASPVLYAILADRKFFPVAHLQTFAQYGGKFGVHLQKNVPGTEITSGSLGQGFGIGAGIALAAKMNRDQYLVFTILGDGECYEGSIWETAMFASHNNLNNLIAIIDRNFLCVTDFTENLLAIEPLAEKWEAFGWKVIRINGHQYEQLLSAFEFVRSRRTKRPLLIVADTVKGKGIEFMSDRPLWHGISPKGDDAKHAIEELERNSHDE